MAEEFRNEMYQVCRRIPKWNWARDFGRERYPVSIVKACVKNGNEGAEDEGRPLLQVSEAVERENRVSAGLFYSGFSLPFAWRAVFPATKRTRTQETRIASKWQLYRGSFRESGNEVDMCSNSDALNVSWKFEWGAESCAAVRGIGGPALAAAATAPRSLAKKKKVLR
jgi:hypothetical protein